MNENHDNNPGTQTLLRLHDDSWTHRWESVRSVLDGVTEEEAAFRDPAYAGVEPVDGFPPPGTILWHVAHIEFYARTYAEIIRTRPVSSYPAVPPPAATTLAGLRSALDSARDELRAAIAALSDADLAQPCLDTMDVTEFVAMAIRHHIWHAGQIAVVRRLWKERGHADEPIAG